MARLMFCFRNLVPALVLSCALGAPAACLASGEAAATTHPLAGQSAAGPLSFVRDVQPALTKAGCNMGACHGSFQGRGGLSLSLLGYDAPKDFAALFQHARGRRASPAAPDHSLILLKATGAVPHGGGVRIRRESECYRVIRQYIAEGCAAPEADAPRVVGLEVSPTELVLAAGESAQLQATAVWSDGVRCDVTPWALYDVRNEMQAEVTPSGKVTAVASGRVPVTIRYMGQVAAVDVTTPFGPATKPQEFVVHNRIDEVVAAEWRKLGLTPAPTCDDAEFVRRVHFDLIGTLPTVEEVTAFLASNAPDKRDRLVDELLERPEYVDYWSLKWSDLLRVHRRYVGEKGLESFSGWVRRAVRENRPIDSMVRELLTAQGNLYSSGPVAFYVVDQKPEELAETTAQIFLGVRMQCTRCHHHPMEVWGQDDYYGLSACFTRLETKDNKDGGRFGGAQVIKVTDKPSKNRRLAIDAPPRLFDRDLDVAEGEDVRQALADAITAPDNPYFARNFANRYWAYLTGRGLVEPVDDFRATNPPSIPALLDALAEEFIAHGYDAKHVLRMICASSVYQRAAHVTPGERENVEFFTHRVPRRLPAEVLLDAVNRAVGGDETFEGVPQGTRAIALPDPSVKSYFLDLFGRPARNSGCECARSVMPDLSQALHLANGAALHDKISQGSSRVGQLVAAKAPRPKVVEELYLATLSRLPTDAERATIDEMLAEVPSEKEGYQDLLWVLINCTEFQFNH